MKITRGFLAISDQRRLICNPAIRIDASEFMTSYFLLLTLPSHFSFHLIKGSFKHGVTLRDTEVCRQEKASDLSSL